MKNSKKASAKLAAKAALTSLIAVGALSLSGCNSSRTNDYVQCFGVAKDGPNTPIYMSKGLCEKLAGSKAAPVTANDYVECYGVAATGKNDCATNTSACGGTAATDRLPQAWVTMPAGICAQLKGGVIGKMSKDKSASNSTATQAAPAKPAAKK